MGNTVKASVRLAVDILKDKVCWRGTVLLLTFTLYLKQKGWFSIPTQDADNCNLHKQDNSSPHGNLFQLYLKTSNYYCHNHIPTTFMTA